MPVYHKVYYNFKICGSQWRSGTTHQTLLLVDSLILLSDSHVHYLRKSFMIFIVFTTTSFTSSGLTSLIAFFVVGGTIFTRFIIVMWYLMGPLRMK